MVAPISWSVVYSPVRVGLIHTPANVTQEPGTSSAATAKNAAVQIANAVVAYETEYGRLPTNSGGTVDGSFMKILTANDPTNNARAIVFLESQAWKKGKGYSNEFYRRSLSTELWINIYIQKSYLPCINIFG
jgi:hypothetical protein